MHSTLTEHARCLFGDEYLPTPECDQEHQEHYFVEELTFADADAILAMLRELSPHGVDGQLPVWVRNPSYRLVLLQRPDEPVLMREAAENLWLHGPVTLMVYAIRTSHDYGGGRLLHVGNPQT